MANSFGVQCTRELLLKVRSVISSALLSTCMDDIYRHCRAMIRSASRVISDHRSFPVSVLLIQHQPVLSAAVLRQQRNY